MNSVHRLVYLSLSFFTCAKDSPNTTNTSQRRSNFAWRNFVMHQGLKIKPFPASKHSWAPRWASWAWWAWACHSKTNVSPMWAKHREFRSQPLYNLYGAFNWLTMGITWAKTMDMLCQCVVKKMVLYRLFLGPINVCPSQYQWVTKQWLYIGIFIRWT